MDALKCSIHFLTLSQTGYDESNVAVTVYHERSHFEATANKRNLYAEFAEEFSLQQGRQFVLHNRVATTPAKMTKLKDQVRQLDQLLVDQSSALICKIIWLNSSRVLIVYDDQSLIWLQIDPVSGDLLKLCIDTSLKEAKEPVLKLSGKKLSDVAFSKLDYFVPLEIVMTLVYTDQNKVDFVRFGRTSQFRDYFARTDGNLEKIMTFEPSLVTVHDLQCPKNFPIEKRILFHYELGY